jgi:hypothetical protein
LALGNDHDCSKLNTFAACTSATFCLLGGYRVVTAAFLLALVDQRSADLPLYVRNRTLAHHLKPSMPGGG